MKAKKLMKCCICEIEIDNGMDYHNPTPLGKDVCCTYCNITKVLPARLKNLGNRLDKVQPQVAKQLVLPFGEGVL
mgnify:CR=1 FL=1